MKSLNINWRIIASQAVNILAIALVTLGIAAMATARWCWSHRREIADGIARAILTTYAAGRWCGAQLRPMVARATVLVNAQGLPDLAPITATIAAARAALERLVARLYPVAA